MSLLVLLLALAAAPPVNDRALYERTCEQVAAAYDSARGGFVAKDGIPSEEAIELALILGREPGPGHWKDRALGTVAWTQGLRDSIGGGFFTRADVDPSHGRFYKQTDVNARRLENLIDAWKLTSDTARRREAAAVVDFMDRVLIDGRGGFLPAQGAAFELVPEANGAAIRAWLEWAAATTDPAKRDFALKSLDRVWSECWVPDVGLVRRGMLEERAELPRLVDQVEMGRALILSARLATRPVDTQRARTLGDLVLDRFQDPEHGEFSSQCGPNRKGGIKRTGPVSTENASAARFLCDLATLTGDLKYRDAARRAWSARAPKLEDLRLAAAGWALAIHAAIEPALPDAPEWPRVAENAPAPTPTRVEIFKPRKR